MREAFTLTTQLFSDRMSAIYQHDVRHGRIQETIKIFGDGANATYKSERLIKSPAAEHAWSFRMWSEHFVVVIVAAVIDHRFQDLADFCTRNYPEGSRKVYEKIIKRYNTWQEDTRIESSRVKI